jgi:DnaJ family protein B protein 13
MSQTEDYYQIFGLPRSCTDSDIKREYRRCALKWHPLKHDDAKKETARAKFRQVSEAYAVLSNARLRAIFDQWGAEGLTNGVRTSAGGDTTPWVFSQNPEDMFREFFGSTSPFAGYFGSESGLSLSLANKGAESAATLPPIEVDVFCSLEELFLGCTKKVKVVRQRIQPDGNTTSPEETVISVEVGAGWRANTKMTFQREGDQAPGAPAGDVVLRLRERPHPFFKRKGNDLQHTAQITLSQALIGCTVPVRTLDGRIIPISVSDIVSPNTVKRVKGEGMPSARNPSVRGDLILAFDIQFPKSLTLAQKEGLRTVLA